MSDDWEIVCSDDEKYDVKKRDGNKWEPSPEQMLKLYEELDKGPGYFELNWKCPGRRSPTPEKIEEQSESESTNIDDKNDEKDYNFDFEIEKGQLRLRPSGESGPRLSAKKKTTSLDAIISNMERYRRLDMMEEDPPETQ